MSTARTATVSVATYAWTISFTLKSSAELLFISAIHGAMALTWSDLNHRRDLKICTAFGKPVVNDL